MTMPDENMPDEQAVPDADATSPSKDLQATPTPNVDQPEPGDDAAPEPAVDDGLRGALGEMREEADRIASLGTGEEQVEAAERFAEDAGKLDEQVGRAARDADGDER